VRLATLEEDMNKNKITMPKSSSLGKGQALAARGPSSTHDSWILDFGASHHMTHDENLLDSLSDSYTTHISIGESSQILVLGINLIQM
jgi:hypothetical protein